MESHCTTVVFHSFSSVISPLVTVLISGVEPECDFSVGGGRDMKQISADEEEGGRRGDSTDCLNL